MCNLTAGAMLAELLKNKEQGVDTAESEAAFEEQSRRQLGGYCSEFAFSEGDTSTQE